MRSLLALSALLLAAPPPDRLNVLLVITDDQGWGDFRSNGNEKIETPNLDRLAAAGARFDLFFVSPVCAPTRASVLTGRYSLRTGVSWVTRGLETMRAEEVTIAEALRDAGYATGYFGKWHNGAHYPHHPNGQGFEDFFGFSGGHLNNYFDTTLERNGKPEKTGGYIADVLTDEAIRYVEAKRDKPFFCTVAFNTPHSPFQVPDRHYEKHRARGLDEKMASVYGMVENLDENLGRLLPKLPGDTVVLFLTDNGPNGPRYNGGMRGAKGSVHEGGIRVPLFIRRPGKIAPGTRVETIAAHIDLFPTILELCGVSAPKGVSLDGMSLVPLLEGRATGWPDRTIFTHQSRQGEARPAPGAARTQRWRWVQEGQRAELFDMAADPGQARDVSKDHPEVAERLRAAYEKWFKDVTRRPIERLPIPVGHPERPAVELPAPEAYLQGGVAWKGRAGWANDWITGWTSLEDQVAWEIDVARPGRYSVTLLYTCPEADVGSRIRIEAGGRSLEAVLARAHDPAPVPSPDRVPRGEVFEKAWGELHAGTLELEKGRTRLAVRAVARPGRAVMELKGVRLGRVE